jgi:hypothetical protein
MRILDCGVHVLQSEVILVFETLEASPEQPALRLRPDVLPAPEPECTPTVPQLLCAELDRTNGLFIKKALQCQTVERKTGTGNRSIALSIGVHADARRISQALTEPEYLEAWISMPNVAGDSRIVASKREDGYRLDQVRAGRSIASFLGSFLFCHQRKMRLSWRDAAAPEMTESLIDFRIRGNFASSVLELRHTALASTGEFLWYQQLWRVSLVRLATILRSA